MASFLESLHLPLMGLHNEDVTIVFFDLSFFFIENRVDLVQGAAAENHRDTDTAGLIFHCG